MTNPTWLEEPCAGENAASERAYRLRFWRLTLGALGLFWVCVALWLVGAFIP